MKRKDVLFLAISSFILVVAWIGFNIYHQMVTSTLSEDLKIKDLEKQTIQIHPDFDTQTIQKLKSREKIIPLYEVIAVSEAPPEPSKAIPETQASPETFSISPTIGQVNGQ